MLKIHTKRFRCCVVTLVIGAALITFNTAFAQTPTPPAGGRAINATAATLHGGVGYIINQNFGTPGDTNTAPTQSVLRIFENGTELGPAHTYIGDIQTIGRGRFVHWGFNLFFSASDNSNPRTNGRSYTYVIQAAPTPAPAPSPPPPPPPPPPVTSTGPVFYASPSGSDSNPGTLSAPWRTIQHAANQLVAGGTVVLLNGSYEEPEIVFRTNGTATQPITVKAQNKWQAIVNSRSGCNPAFSLLASYITVQDLRFSVSPNNPTCGIYTSASAAIRAWPFTDPTPANPSTGTQGATVRGVLIDYSAARSTGIKTNQDLSLMENNVIHSELEAFNNFGNIFRNTVIPRGGPNGTHILGKGGARNFQVYNNVIHVTQSGSKGIILGGAPFSYWDTSNIECYNCVAYNNVVLVEGGATNVAVFGMMGAKDSVIFNNVGIGGSLFLAPSDASRTPPGLNVNPTFKNNIVDCKGGPLTQGYHGWDGYYTGTVTLDSNNFYNCSSGVPPQTRPIVGAPLFVDPSSDWHLQAGSLSLASGVEVQVIGFNGEVIDVSRNRDGNIRATPWRLGIY